MGVVACFSGICLNKECLIGVDDTCVSDKEASFTLLSFVPNVCSYL